MDVAASGSVAVCGDAGGVVGFAPDGRRRWRRTDLRARGVTVADPGMLVVATGGLAVLDPETGETRWRYDERGVFVAEEFDLDAGEPLLRLDRTDGTTRWSVTYERITAGPFLAPSGVLVAAEGDLVCHVP
jgi:outer membrane protein assembly factor BamB